MAGKLIRERDFYKSFFVLMVTLMLQEAVVMSVNLADNLMLGNYSEDSLSAVAAVNQIQFVYQQIIGATGGILVMLGSQYWGSGRPEVVRSVTAVAMRTALCVGAVFFAAVSLAPERVMRLFTTDAATVSEGALYLRIIRWSYFPFAVTLLLLNMIRIAEKVRIALWTSIMSLVINCVLNYLLIGGKFGAPAMGIRGAALGTLIARLVECAVVLFYIFRVENKLRLRFGDLFLPAPELASDFFRVGYPMFITGTLWGVSNALQSVILGHMEAGAMAAYSISSTVFLLLKSASVGANSSASVLIGKALGAGDRTRVRQYANTLQLLFIGVGLTLGSLLFLLRPPLLRIYGDVSQSTLEMANTFLLIQSVVICTMSYQMPTNGGIIRAGGDTRYVMILDLVSIWGIVMPLSLCAAFVWKLSPVGVVMLLNCDQVFKCVPAALRARSNRWMRKLTRD